MSRAVRIAILGTRGIPASYGGFETFAEELGVRLAAAGVQVTVYCEAGAGEQPGEYRGVRLRHLPAPAFGPLTTVLFDLRCLWHARRGFDVVYLLGYGAAPFCFLPRLHGTQVWLNVDGIEWRRAKWGRVAREYFKAMEFCSVHLPDRVIADAAGVRAHLRERHRRSVPCSVIAYGAPVVDEAPGADELSAWEVRADAYWLVVCRLEPENHVREIVEGFLASDSPYPLLIVGDHRVQTDYVRGLRALASDRVRLLGAVYDAERLRMLRFHALAYFHGHSVGGTNPSLLEAMGCGNLVIAHDNVFNREVLAKCGRFFRTPEDISRLVREVQMLDSRERAAERARAHARVKTRYGWDRITRSYLRLLGRVRLQATKT